MPLIYFDTPGIVTVAGIFIPRDNIFGLTANIELIASEPDIVKQCKFLAGFLASFESTIASNRADFNSLSTALGFTVTKEIPSGVSPNVFTQTFTASVAQVVDYSTSTFYPIPVPISGSNSGRGVLKITDVFPDAVSVASAGSIAKAGVLIPHTEVDAYGAATNTNPANDTQSRQWFAAMLRYLFNEIPIRVNTDTGTFSAVITKTLGTVSSFTLPADALSSSNPSTGLDPTKVSINDVYSRTIQFNIEFLLNEEFRRFEVRTSLNPNFNLPIVNITRPSVLEFLNVPASSINPVESINVRFSEAINPSSFNFNDISLTRDNGINLVNSGVTIEYINETIYQIKGLTNLTSTSGSYQLTIDTNGIQNLEGNTGDTTAQTSFSINSVVDLISNLPPITASVVGGQITNDAWGRASFTTGSYSYIVTSVILRFVQIVSATPPNNLLVRLYNDNAGALGSEIASFNFTNPSSITTTTSNNIFTLSTPQTLSANTTFWLVVRSDSGQYLWALTNSTNETGETGWFIGNNSLFSGNQGGTWTSYTDGLNFQFAVRGWIVQS